MVAHKSVVLSSKASACRRFAASRNVAKRTFTSNSIVHVEKFLKNLCLTSTRTARRVRLY